MAQADRHLIIDGYNVIHAVDDFRPLLPRSLDLACTQLVERVRIIHDIEGIAVTTVFDGKGTSIDIQKPGGQPGFSVIYAPVDATADGIIEQLVRNAPDPREVTVASRDNLIAEGARSSGGVCIWPEDLMGWVARCEGRMARLIAQKRQQSRRLGGSDDPWRALDAL